MMAHISNTNKTNFTCSTLGRRHETRQNIAYLLRIFTSTQCTTECHILELLEKLIGSRRKYRIAMKILYKSHKLLMQLCVLIIACANNYVLKNTAQLREIKICGRISAYILINNHKRMRLYRNVYN